MRYTKYSRIVAQIRLVQKKINQSWKDTLAILAILL